MLRLYAIQRYFTYDEALRDFIDGRDFCFGSSGQGVRINRQELEERGTVYFLMFPFNLQSNCRLDGLTFETPVHLNQLIKLQEFLNDR